MNSYSGNWNSPNYSLIVTAGEFTKMQNWLFHLPPNTCSTRHKGHWPGFGEQAEANNLLPRQVSAQLTFFKIPKIPRVLPVRDVIRTCLPRFPSGLF